MSKIYHRIFHEYKWRFPGFDIFFSQFEIESAMCISAFKGACLQSYLSYVFDGVPLENCLIYSRAN